MKGAGGIVAQLMLPSAPYGFDMHITDLRNYGEVLRKVAPGRPMFLTRNGGGRYAVVIIDDWDRIEPARRLLVEFDWVRASAAQDVQVVTHLSKPQLVVVDGQGIVRQETMSRSCAEIGRVDD